jgi:UDP-N-acetylmuramoyl-tripeptide--D-alanyl-D-alanine ligase
MTGALWRRDDALAAISAQIPSCRASGGDWVATGISIDSRDTVPGDVFVALIGPNNDGHEYAAEALAKGAVAALVHYVPENLPKNANLIVVQDTLDGLRALAVAARARSRAKIVAVTGSVGKTGTKEMLRLVFGAAGATHASIGSLNNHWGVPLSLARMPEDAAFGLFELGMNHAGEIGPLSRMVRPHVSIITTIEAAHLEFFRSLTEIALAKAEIFAGMEPDGVAILPRDNREYGVLAGEARAANITDVESFGSHIDSQARLLHARTHSTSTDVLALFGEHSLSYRLGIAGRHWATNSLAVLLAAKALGLSLEAASSALLLMEVPKGRGRRLTLPWSAGTIEVIDETYNANPASMRAAIAVLAAAEPGRGGRRIAVLGDMLELGASSPELHAELAQVLSENGIDLVFASGPLMQSLFDALPRGMAGGHAAASSQISEAVRAALSPGDVVMVKGSAGSKMGRVIDALADSPAQDGTRRRANGG